VKFFLVKANSDVSILLMILLPFAKLCEVDERMRGENLSNRLGEEKAAKLKLSRSAELKTPASKARM
jgi:hypothetical protein